MKCPDCGKDIMPGHLYCESCGKEINVVPDFDPLVENRIKESLTGVAKNLEDEDIFFTKQLPKVSPAAELKKYLPLYLIGIIIFAILLFSFLFLGGNSSSSSFEEQAENYYVEGNYLKAIAAMTKALDAVPENDTAQKSGLLLKLYGYQHEAGYEDDAIETLKILTDSDTFDEQTVLTAIDNIVLLYEEKQDYEAIHDLVSNCRITSVKAKYAAFIPSAPVFSLKGGVYNETLNISISSSSEGTIYYTVGGDTPTEGSIKYGDELVIEEEGEYDIKAVLVNKYGISSDISNEYYIVENIGPKPPEIMEDSGEYSQTTMIVAVCDAGCSIYYTTDGSDPTELSKQYLQPISMPLGTSTFKFVTIDQEGRISDVVEKNYHLSYTKLVSVEQARSNIINTLVKLDILLDAQGKMRGEEGYYDYVYDREIEITGSGDYYIFLERHVYNDGTTNDTGLLYAVDSHDGKVNRLGYDSSGNYTLITISNR